MIRQDATPRGPRRSHPRIAYLTHRLAVQSVEQFLTSAISAWSPTVAAVEASFAWRSMGEEAEACPANVVAAYAVARGVDGDNRARSWACGKRCTEPNEIVGAAGTSS